jgi:iron complex transport system substrate-binding protein
MSRAVRACRLTGIVFLLMIVARGAADAAPARVIALGGDVTEIVYALGEEARLAARDSTSLFPEAARALPEVGYLRQLGAEGVLSLRPDLILASATAGPPEVLQQIHSAGVPLVMLPQGFDTKVLGQKIEAIARALDVPEKGEALAAKLNAQIKEVQAEVAKLEGHPKVLFIIAAAGGAPMAAGRDTGADALIALAGGENVFAAHEGYKAISLESAAAAGPEAIALMDHTLGNMGGTDSVVKHAALRLTPAAKAKRIVAREGGYLLGFGPRLPEAILDFAKAIRSEAAK